MIPKRSAQQLKFQNVLAQIRARAVEHGTIAYYGSNVFAGDDDELQDEIGGVGDEQQFDC